MAATTTFPNIPAQIGSSKDVEITVLDAQFGDGYEQVTNLGINDIRDTWAIQFTNITNDEADTIEAFLIARRGSDPFFWTAPNESTEKQYRCRKWKRVPKNPNQASMTMAFREAFDL